MSDVVMVGVDEVLVGERRRKDMGDLRALAESMRSLGLLQPIGVDKDRRLVFGGRRLRAAQDFLGWKVIAARVIDVDALLAERDENELHKPFTPTERAAVADAIKARLGSRQGKRTDLDGKKPRAAPPPDEDEPPTCGPGATSSDDPSPDEDEPSTSVQLDRSSDDPEEGERTEAFAAEQAGLSRASYLRVKQVEESGTPALVGAMDRGELSIGTAAEAATLPADEQDAVVEDVRAGKRPRAAVADRKKAAGAPAPETDGWGIPVQPHALEAFAALPKFKELAAAIAVARRLFDEVASLPGGKFLTLPSVSSYRRGRKGDDGGDAGRFVHPGLEQALRQVRDAAPAHTVCPWNYVDAPHPEDCPACCGLNWTPALGANVPESAVQRAREAHGHV